MNRCGIAWVILASTLHSASSLGDDKPKPFPSPPGTHKYSLKADITDLATDENGDLSPEYPATKKKIEKLIEDAGRFDLTKPGELVDYAEYVGKALRLPKAKQIGFEIKTDAGRDLFIGKLRMGKSGTYELLPNTKGK